MSIISQALKKAEQEHEKRLNKASMPVQKTTIAVKSPGKKKTIFPAKLLGIIAVLLLTVIAGSAFFMIQNNIVNHAPVSQAIQAGNAGVSNSLIIEKANIRPVKPVKKVSQTRAKTYRYDLEQVSLNGIMYRKDVPIALLDDVMVHEGDEYKGYKVIKIDGSKVSLDAGGQVRTLTLRN